MRARIGGARERHRGLVLLVVAGVTFGSAATGYAASLALASQKLTVFRTCMLTATPSSTTAVSDTYVSLGGGNPSKNFGTDTTMFVNTGSSQNRRIYISFDLTRCSPSIPATTTVSIAVLRTYVTVLPTVCRTQDIFRVTGSWTETGITWNNQPFGTSSNNPPSGQRTDSIDVGAAPCQNSTTGAYVSGWDVATDVQAFVSGTATNYGWMIRDDVESSSTTRTSTYTTKDANVLARAPQLVVVYEE